MTGKQIDKLGSDIMVKATKEIDKGPGQGSKFSLGNQGRLLGRGGRRGLGLKHQKRGRYLKGTYWTISENGRGHPRSLRRKGRGGTGMEMTIRGDWTPSPWAPANVSASPQQQSNNPAQGGAE